MNQSPVVIFDLDGTLLDSMTGLADCAELILSQVYGLSKDDARTSYLETSGIPFFEQLQVLFPDDPRNVSANESFCILKKNSYMNWKLYPGVKELLYKLKQASIRTAISSNSEHLLVKKIVKKQKIPVDLALGWQPGCVKGPDHFSYFSSHFDVGFDQLFFVGDSLWDAKYAAEASIPFAAKVGTLTSEIFNSNYPEARLFRHVVELESVLFKWRPSSSLLAAVGD